jgi:hypothetical protein
MQISTLSHRFLPEAAYAVPSSNGPKPVAERRIGDASALARRHAS